MKPGIFAKTFQRGTLEEVLDAMQSLGLSATQFNMACAGLPPLPERISPELSRVIGDGLKQRGMSMSAVSGTFNMIHPHPAEREQGLKCLRVLAEACKEMGTETITLCTGSMDPVNMWAYHPGNASPEAWRLLTSFMEQALTLAQQFHVGLAIEPEAANVVSSAPLARRLLDEMQSPYLKIVMDAANLYPAGNKGAFSTVLEEAFELLGSDIVLAHAKDVLNEEGTVFGAAGQGLVDYRHYISLLHACGYRGPLVLHGLREDEVPRSLAFLNEHLA